MFVKKWFNKLHFFNTNIAIYGVCGLNAVLANFWHFYRPATLWVDIAFINNLADSLSRFPRI